MQRLGFESVLSRDYPVIMAIAFISALLTLLGMLVSDMLCAVVDLRILRGGDDISSLSGGKRSAAIFRGFFPQGRQFLP